MAESFVLTTPLTQQTTQYSVRSLLLSLDSPSVRVVLMDQAGVRSTYEYVGETALTLVIQLNKANLSVSSLQRRILEQLAADGKIGDGAVTGTPD